MNEQPTLSSTTPGGAPWTSDATKNSTLATLRAAYPKSTPFGASITCDMAWAMVRGQPGFAPTPIFGVDVEADGLAAESFVQGPQPQQNTLVNSNER